MLSRRTIILGAACMAIAGPALASDPRATAFVTAIYAAYKGKNASGREQRHVYQENSMALLFRLMLILAFCLAAGFNDRSGAADINPTAPQYCSISAPPPELELDHSFYRKYCKSAGLAIAGSARVPDAAFQAAADIVSHMLASMPNVRKKLVAAKVHVAIIGATEKTTDIPEYSQLKGDTSARDWDKTTRGLGATVDIPVVSGAEENLLCYPPPSSNISAPDDPTADGYHGENIFVHEFSHTIKQMGIEAINPQFRQQVQNAYQHAKDGGLWHDTYSMQDAEEYWAEGVESYFDANLLVHPPNGIHNEINTRAKLKGYDPQLYDLIDGAFHGGSWRPPCFR
jgi:hypothetical protein